VTNLDDLVRERYETGAHGGTHLVVAPDVVESMPRKPRPPVWAPHHAEAVIDGLLGIPILVDQDMGPGAWRLVDTATKKTLRWGIIPHGGSDE
jgi:hypothetical protein